MAKTVKFPLEMDNGAEVRSMEELREQFSLAHVLRYVESGKLSKWLRARYEDEIADEIDNLDPDDQELAKKVSEIFGVPYDEKAEEELEREKLFETLKTVIPRLMERFLKELQNPATFHGGNAVRSDDRSDDF